MVYRDGAHFLRFSTACLCWATVSFKSWGVRHMVPGEKLTSKIKFSLLISLSAAAIYSGFPLYLSPLFILPLPGGQLRAEQTNCLFLKLTFLSWRAAGPRVSPPFPHSLASCVGMGWLASHSRRKEGARSELGLASHPGQGHTPGDTLQWGFPENPPAAAVSRPKPSTVPPVCPSPLPDYTMHYHLHNHSDIPKLAEFSSLPF